MRRWAEIVIFSITLVSQIEYAKAADAVPSTRQGILLTVTEQDYLIGGMHAHG